jgi:hypothetical protein
MNEVCRTVLWRVWCRPCASLPWLLALWFALAHPADTSLRGRFTNPVLRYSKPCAYAHKIAGRVAICEKSGEPSSVRYFFPILYYIYLVKPNIYAGETNKV